MTDIKNLRDAFAGVGWFIPPYVGLKFLDDLAFEIDRQGKSFAQADLERFLALVYSPGNLAAMVCSRYSVTPHIQDYREIISEAIEVHFLGLDHISIAGLMPVIEGVGRRLATSRLGRAPNGVKAVFENLMADCKKDVIKNRFGAVDEVVMMLDSFGDFTASHLYIESSSYSLADKTNRHGILHGAYCDKDYGTPINFYKAIAAVDFLCFVAAFHANISWLAPAPNAASKLLARHYGRCNIFKSTRPKAP